MRQVDIRVMHPTTRLHTRATVLDKPAQMAETVLLLALIASFWGAILFVALTTAVR